MGLVLILGGPSLEIPTARQRARRGSTLPAELEAYIQVQAVRRTVLTGIVGPRFVVGDGLAWSWPQEPNVFAIRGATAAHIRAVVLQLPRQGPVEELVVWLGSDDLHAGRSLDGLVTEVAEIVAYVQPASYVVVAPQPVWNRQGPILAQRAAHAALLQHFGGRLVDPLGRLQSALFIRAPAYYDDFLLTAVGYDHVSNHVRIGLGYNEALLPLSHGIEEFGAMVGAQPAGIALTAVPLPGV